MSKILQVCKKNPFYSFYLFIVIVRFPLKDEPSVSFVAWTTTPWTLPSNLALCVHPDFTYIQVKSKSNGEQFIVNEKCTLSLFKNESEYEVIKSFIGKTLEGKFYIPLFNYFLDRYPQAFRIICDTYVTDTDGTGIVHQAPAFGEDDNRVCVREGICSALEVPCPINNDGFFTNQVPDFYNQYVKTADNSIIKHLKQHNRLVSRATVQHSYPFCWRSDTPLIYRAIPSWFIKVTDIRDRLLKNNSETYWVPEFVKEKRFHNWLSDARDWAISRNRYWGTPLPIWVSDDDEERVVISSIDELERLSGKRVTDLHRQFLDDITIPSKQGKGLLHRVPEVFDCWFESGSMPYAQQHYPFENQEKFESSFPADFIAEGIDQTRGWFYTLLVISTALFDKPPFKNLIVNGLVLAADGKKMSKRLKNYPDPIEIINKFGADAMRLYLINSPVVRAETLKFQEKGVSDIINDVFLRWYNAYRFLIQNLLRMQNEGQTVIYDKNIGTKTKNVTDKWLLSSSQSLLKFVKQEMAAYRLYTVVPKLIKFIDSLANWYVRLNRNRLKGVEGKLEEQNSISTLASTLLTLCRAMAPFTPFFVESLYQNLRYILPEQEREQSVHYLTFPDVDQSLIDPDIELHMSRMQEVIELGRLSRDIAICPIRQPLKEFIVFNEDKSYLESLKFLEPYILSEVSVRTLTLRSDLEGSISHRITPNHKVLGPKLRNDSSKVTKALIELSKEQVQSFLSTSRITLFGYDLTIDDVSIVPEFKGGDINTKYQSSGNNHVITVLDLTKDQAAIDGRLVREIINRVQRLRKHAKLMPYDNVITFYSWIVSKDFAEINLDRIISENLQQIQNTTNCPLISIKYMRPDYLILDKVDDDLIEGVKISLNICRPDVYVDIEAIVSDNIADLKTALNLETFALSLNPEFIKNALTNGTLELNLEGKLYSLGSKHIFPTAFEKSRSKELN